MTRRGFTLVDLLVSIACIMLLASLLVSCGGGPLGISQARIDKDKSQLRGLYQTIETHSQDSNELPLPSHIARHPVMIDGEEVYMYGMGEPDWSKNTSANLYSALIGQNYFTPEILVSPIENSPAVSVMNDYNYAAYDPIQGSYWDDNFRCDLSRNGQGSNASYAHYGLVGKRVRMPLHQRNELEPMFSNRGPGGLPGSREFDASPTLLIMGSPTTWDANFSCLGSRIGGVQNQSISSPVFTADGQSDPIFLTDDQSGDDVWLGIFTASTENGATPSFDPLMN